MRASYIFPAEYSCDKSKEEKKRFLRVLQVFYGIQLVEKKRNEKREGEKKLVIHIPAGESTEQQQFLSFLLKCTGKRERERKSQVVDPKVNTKEKCKKKKGNKRFSKLFFSCRFSSFLLLLLAYIKQVLATLISFLRT